MKLKTWCVNLCRQIEKQVEVLKAYYNTEDEIVWQELALYKVPTDVIADRSKSGKTVKGKWRTCRSDPQRLYGV